jgi:hypothetical protein
VTADPVEILSLVLAASYWLALAIPIILVIKVRTPRSPLPRAGILLFVSAAAMSLTVICCWYALDLALLDLLQDLDRNGDGVWSDAERATLSARERAQYELLVDDGARNLFALYVYPIFSLTYSSVVVGGWMLFTVWRDSQGHGR